MTQPCVPLGRLLNMASLLALWQVMIGDTSTMFDDLLTVGN